MWSKTILKAGGILKLDLTIKVDQIASNQVQSSFEYLKDVDSTNFQSTLFKSLTTLTVIFVPVIQLEFHMLQLVLIGTCQFSMHLQDKCVNLLPIAMRELMCLRCIPETSYSKSLSPDWTGGGQKTAKRSPRSNLNREKCWRVTGLIFQC